MTSATVGIVTFEDFQRRTHVGSSRIRAQWLLNYWDEAELFTTGRRYQVVIFQKAYWWQYAETYEGLKILDICEPDFLNWRRDLRRMMECCDAITASTEALVKVLKNYTNRPVLWIPDRLDPQVFEGTWKDHSAKGRTKTVAWYGYSHNFAALDTMVEYLPELGIRELIVVADKHKPYQLSPALCGRLELRNFPWALDTLLENLLKADLVINPRILTGRWKYKSDNKTLTAWAIGLPVAHNVQELSEFLTEATRVKEANRRYQSLFEKYHVRSSVNEYKRLINELKLNRKKSTGAAQLTSIEH